MCKKAFSKVFARPILVFDTPDLGLYSSIGGSRLQTNNFNSLLSFFPLFSFFKVNMDRDHAAACLQKINRSTACSSWEWTSANECP